MRQVESIGETLEEAKQKALEELGIKLEDADSIEVLDEGSKGFLGIGARPAKVRITTSKAPEVKPESKKSKEPSEKSEKGTAKQVKSKEKASDRVQTKSTSSTASQKTQKVEKEEVKTANQEQQAQKDSKEKVSKVSITDAQGNETASLLKEILQKMGIEAEVRFVRTKEGTPKLDIESQEGALLIGRKGSNLEAIEFIINRIVSGAEENESIEKFVVDTENYLARRKESLKQLALNYAERVRKSGRKIKLSPMPPHERRVIHLTLQDDNTVETFSIGKGDNRCVVIAPKYRPRNRFQRDRRDNRRDNTNRYPGGRRQNDRRGGRRDYRPDWRRRNPGRSPYSDDTEPGQISE